MQNLNLVTSMVFLPDGSMLMGQVNGTIRVVQPGAIQPDSTPFNAIPNAVAQGDAGLHGLTLDPNFSTNNFYYVFYAHAQGAEYRDRVSRFTAASDWNSTIPGSELVLWEDDVNNTDSHHGASVVFGPDGKLYVSIGDNGQASDSQSLSSYHGKILRINRDRSIPSDNPFVDGPGGNKDEIWAYGLRNPYRFSFDAVTGNLYLGDVGGNDVHTAVEEVDLDRARRQLRLALCARALAGSPGSRIRSTPTLTRDSMRRSSRTSFIEGPSSRASIAAATSSRTTRNIGSRG